MIDALLIVLTLGYGVFVSVLALADAWRAEDAPALAAGAFALIALGLVRLVLGAWVGRPAKPVLRLFETPLRRRLLALHLAAATDPSPYSFTETNDV